MTGTLSIPESVTSIGTYAFSGRNGLTAIDVDESNTNYSSVGGVLFNNDTTTLIQCPGGKQGEYTIPNTVTSIGNSAFSGCSGLTSVTIPEGVTSIGISAFRGCSGVTSLTIGEGVTKIDSEAFSNCSELDTVVFMGSKPTTFRTNVFYGITGAVVLSCPYGDDSWDDFEDKGYTNVSTVIRHCLNGHTAADPDETPTVVAATCSATGTSTKTCENPTCDGVTVLDIDPTAHSAVTGTWTSGSPATCETASTRIETCTYGECTHTIATDNTAALGHDETEISATCTTDKVCARTGCTHVLTAKLEHNWGELEVITAPTETETGLKAKLCIRDNCTAQTDEQIIPATGAVSIGKVQKSDSRFGIRFAQNIVSTTAEISVVLPNNDKPTKTNIVVYDMTGNVVYETSNNGNFVWNLTNSASRTIANGTYLVIAEVKGQNGMSYYYSAKLGVKK